MKTRFVPGFLLLTFTCMLLSLPAVAGSILYTNGPVNGNNDAWNMSGPYAVSDSFGLASASTVTSIAFGVWVFAGDTPTSVMWSITSAPGGGTVYGSGTASLTNILFCHAGASCGLGQADVYTSSFATNVALGSGTYWLNFQGGTSSLFNALYWDENDGVGCSGTGCPSAAFQTFTGTIPSESFTLSTSIPIPEPEGTMVLFGGGIFTFAGILVRRLRTRSASPLA